MSPGTSLRARRMECGLTQTELAARAGVSRQLLVAVEAGRNTPSVGAALALARALGASVEELFADRGREVVAALGTGPRPGVPLRVGRVGDRLVATEVAGHGVAGDGWARPDAVIEAGQLRLFAGASPAGAVVAGCDPAFGLAERMLDGLGPRSVLAISAPTDAALRALGAGRLHAAVVHGVERKLPESPVAVARWHVARWQVGVAVAAKFAGASLEAVVRRASLAQRDRAAASQQAFERARIAAGLPRPAGPTASGHLDAARIAATLESAAVTNESAARAFGLRFLPLEEHAVELWVAERWQEHPGIQALTELLATKAFTDRVARYGGYDLARSGERIGAGSATAPGDDEHGDGEVSTAGRLGRGEP